jgi:hypothetical protein
LTIASILEPLVPGPNRLARKRNSFTFGRAAGNRRVGPGRHVEPLGEREALCAVMRRPRLRIRITPGRSVWRGSGRGQNGLVRAELDGAHGGGPTAIVDQLLQEEEWAAGAEG